MSLEIDARLQQLGLSLPQPMGAVGTYVPWVIAGNQLFLSGQGPLRDGKLDPRFRGKLGQSVNTPQGSEAAQLTMLNVLAHVKVACGGDWDRVIRCVHSWTYVSCTEAFMDMQAVAAGGLDLLTRLWGGAGQHAGSLLGVPSLPFDICVHTAVQFELG